MEWLIMLGIPTGITGVFFGILQYKIQKMLNKQEEERKKYEEAKEKKAQDREDNREKLMLMQIKHNRAAVKLSEATARAVQRIPDAHCNGDMTAALDYAVRVQREQKDFLMELGLHTLYDEEE